MLEAVGLTWADIMPPRPARSPEDRRRMRQAMREAGWASALAVLALEVKVALVAGRQLTRWRCLSEEDDARLAPWRWSASTMPRPCWWRRAHDRADAGRGPGGIELEQETSGSVASPENATLQQVFRQPVMVDAEGLMAADFPERERLLSPWLLSQSLSMIYAPRGIGKTHVALGIAYALASGGSFLGWSAATPVRVAYLDGEMPGADLRDRVRRIAAAAELKAQPGHLQFMTPDLQPGGIMPNLYDRAGQQAIVAAAGDAQVIIVDNISALVRGGKENEESWQPVAEWALSMRSSGRSVVFIHHAGKGGQQRGASSARTCWIPSSPCAGRPTTRPTKAPGLRCTLKARAVRRGRDAD